MFLTRAFRLYFIFLIFQAYLSLSRNSTLCLASRNYSLRLKIPAKNILLSENKSSQQQLPTPNFECLVAKHVMFAPNYNMFFPHVYTVRFNQWYVSLSYKILEFLPHPITLLLVICVELPITRTVFGFTWRFELSGVDFMMAANLIPPS